MCVLAIFVDFIYGHLSENLGDKKITFQQPQPMKCFLFVLFFCIFTLWSIEMTVGSLLFASVSKSCSCHCTFQTLAPLCLIEPLCTLIKASSKTLIY